MKFRVLSTSFLILLYSVAHGADLRHPSSLNSFCVDPARDALCAEFPDDQTDFSDKFVYMFINVETQTPFDIFSWQAFTAMNWRETNLPEPERNADWQGYSRRPEVFGNDLAMMHCSAHAAGAEVTTASIVQSDGLQLIDQNGNFVVFETRINPAAEAYVLDGLLHSSSGQEEWGNKPVSFPQGRIGKEATPASVLLKTAWFILPDGVDEAGYIVKDGLIYVPAEQTANGEALCLRERLGMLGMHIVARIHSGNGDEWLWTTFEHNATAPTAVNARRVNAIFANDLFPEGCTGPQGPQPSSFALYNPDRADLATNQPPDRAVLWAPDKPYARLASGKVASGTQVVRCWEVFEGTREMNELWQGELRDTPLSHYQLISTQWRGADKSPMFEHGEVPRFLTNTTMETYLQFADEGTCLGCHADATTTTGEDANFTFLLRAPRPQ